MKFLNDFKNLFAIVGVVSIIFWTCASESTSDTTNVNPPQLTGGTYQVEHVDDNGYRIVVLNTETGVMKSYYRDGSNDGIWIEGSGTTTFTH
jgi:hypothetical protein